MTRRPVTGATSQDSTLLTDDHLLRRVVAMADDFRRYRALVDGAVVCEDILRLLEDYFAARAQVLVTPIEGEAISGYHREHLTRMVRQGKLPDLRPKGSKGRILIPLSALPFKPGRGNVNAGTVDDIATRLFRQRNKRDHGKKS